MTVVAIGALGGSGTRAVARLFFEAGVFLGDELNRALDNLLFARLFKDPDWYRRLDERDFRRRLRIFRRLMCRQALGPADLLALRRALRGNRTFPSSPEYIRQFGPGRLLPSAGGRGGRWGWKEPNTQFFAEPLLRAQGDIKYVHVLRHGLDMAFSGNRKQLFNWGFIHGITPPQGADEATLARLQLDFWIATTRRVRALEESFGDRVFVLNLGRLVAEPLGTLAELLRFADLDPGGARLAELARIPRRMASDGRFRTRDCGIFSGAQIEAVREAGFEV